MPILSSDLPLNLRQISKAPSPVPHWHFLITKRTRYRSSFLWKVCSLLPGVKNLWVMP